MIRPLTYFALIILMLCAWVLWPFETTLLTLGGLLVLAILLADQRIRERKK